MKNILSLTNLKATLVAAFCLAFVSSSNADEYRYFLAQWNGAESIIYEVTIDGTDANLAEVTRVPYGSHIAFNEGTESLFIINSNNADYQTFNFASNSLSAVFDIDAPEGASYTATGFNGSSIVIGSSTTGKIYSNPADLLTSSVTEIATGPVSGGDIVYKGDDLYLATRSSNRLLVLDGASFNPVGNIASNSTGMALMEDGKFLISFLGSTTLKIYNEDGSFNSNLNTKLDGAVYTQLNGDMASGSFANPNSCYASSVVFFNQGLTASGNPVRPERSNPNEALGAPNAQNPSVVADVQNFYSLGFGGSIELQFPNPIANGPGADIKIWESSASANNETSLIEVSQDGLGYLPVGQINGDGEVDFGDSFSDFIQFVRITDVTPNNGSGNIYTDGFDLDAVECIHGEYIPCLPIDIVDYAQGATWDGVTPVSAERSILANALGMPEMSDATTPESDVNFFSLGFGGFVTYEFEGGIANGPGDDIMVYETTFEPSTQNCNRYPEKIQAFASQDGCNFWYLGEGCQNASFDLGEDFTWAKYIKLVDITDRQAGVFPNEGGDGYDVDGIMCLNGSAENTEIEGEFGYATEAWLNQGKRKNGTDVALSRSDKTKALGMPEGTNTINFVSLGFGGTIILKFDFVVFDQDGDDIQIVETTFGNRPCNSYPEKAMVRGSLNGIDYFEIAPEDICLDGTIDLAPYGPIQYIELKDRSAISDFNNSADGYDVDGVVVLANCSGEAVDQARIADDISTPDELGGLTAYPNPFSNVVTVEISTGENDTEALVEVSNYLGQRVSLESINAAPTSVVLHNVNARELDKGIYFITVTTNSIKETMKVVKH